MTEKNINCIVVDDEPIAREIIQSFIEQTPRLELIASCKNAFEAITALQTHAIDLIFSDIQMPKVDGLQFVKSLPHPPAIIFITAYENYAVESFELNVLDYLVKPISYERFLKAVNKIRIQIPISKNNVEFAINYIFVKADNKIIKILIKDIIHIESIKDYIKIHTSSSKMPIVVYSTLNKIEEKLPQNVFHRIHQSHLVSLTYVKCLLGNVVEMTDNTTLPISKSHKLEFYKILNIGE